MTGATETGGRPTPARRPAARLRWWRKRRGNIAAFIFLAGVACVTLLPFYWMASSSLRTMETMFSLPIQWIPDPPNWQSYAQAWKAQDFTRTR